MSVRARAFQACPRGSTIPGGARFGYAGGPCDGRLHHAPAPPRAELPDRQPRAGRGPRTERERDAEAIAARLRYDEARAAHAEGRVGDAELACTYVAERVHRAAGSRWLQAEIHPPRPASSRAPAVRLFAERELCRVPRAVPAALCAWADGERPVDLLFRVPTPRELLRLQARGRRCVSLLDDDVPTAPHEDGLAFAVHDLCHLEKFIDPAHHTEQVGFFALLDRGLDHPRFAALQASLDALWIDDRDHVLADMNGSAVFLFLVLKNKLKLAVRRRIARERGQPPPAGGPLDPDEAAACEDAYATLHEALALPDHAVAAARALSSRHDAEAAAPQLLAWLREVGASRRADR